ncbi:Fibronectin, fibrinogen-binding protein [Fructilactobacillus florum 8D]|uniref:Rqc2 homolog RqcH n=1 Tax=Fructilactobacillus florum 8D TaxID=1221538 RepID=W9EH69_9LACO|nr:NFACT RNA binding domain-containing protein [Fructilactobacillus florum]ETO40611.1 Fibronectin, fibrinogen-binding protein [Fructilactobacillus florum 8D]
MTFDGSFTHAMVHQLTPQLTGGRVTKISEPYPNEVMLIIRANHTNYQVLLSANPNFARLQLTNQSFTNPPVPSNFTMTLRKHLQGSFLKEMHQVENDRVVHFHFTTRNEIGDETQLVLVIEIMARHSNIILVEAHNRNIIDAVKRIGADKNRYRTLLPGVKYLNPPQQDRINPFTMTNLELIHKLVHNFPAVNVLAEQLQTNFQGLSYETALSLAETIHNPNLEVNTAVTNFFANFDNPKPVIIKTSSDRLDYAAFPSPDHQVVTSYDTLSSLLDNFYQKQAERERVRELGSSLFQVTRTELKKNRRKLKKLKKTREQAQTANDDRICGELLMTYLNKVPAGATSVRLPNFYDENQLLTINLQPDRSANGNAQHYFKQYQKKKNSLQYVTTQIENTKTEIDYFENLTSQLELATPTDLVDIKTELTNAGYLHSKQKHSRARAKISQPEKFMAPDGTLILVGKNNFQNDQLTLKTADKRDYWLHAQQIHGSHVIIKSANPSPETLKAAATLAAYFSKARASANVPVDFTQVKHVKKPRGGKPGFVHYTDQKTIFVTPTPAAVTALRS